MANFNTHMTKQQILTALQNGLTAASQSDLTALQTVIDAELYDKADKSALSETNSALANCLNGKCKNLLNVFDSQSAAGASSVTISGVTWTINTDGSITADSGGNTLTANSSFIIFGSGAAFKTGVTTILSGCPAGGSDSTYCQVLRIGDTYYRDTGSGVEIPIAPAVRQCGITIYSGQIANHTFWPMLCPKRIQDIAPEFVAYYPSLPEMWQAIRAL